MITGYSEHAANERTFLAWVRTGIAVIAFGVVVEKFNFFMVTLAGTALAERLPSERLARLLSRVGRYEGLALIVGGLLLVVLATLRFVRTTRLLDDPRAYSAQSVRAELVLSAWLVLLISTYALYMALS